MTQFQVKRNAAIAAEMALRDTMPAQVGCSDLDICQVGTHVQIYLTAEQAALLAKILKSTEGK